jgi:hypothetical protein
MVADIGFDEVTRPLALVVHGRIRHQKERKKFQRNVI